MVVGIGNLVFTHDGSPHVRKHKTTIGNHSHTRMCNIKLRIPTLNGHLMIVYGHRNRTYASVILMCS